MHAINPRLHKRRAKLSALTARFYQNPIHSRRKLKSRTKRLYNNKL